MGLCLHLLKYAKPVPNRPAFAILEFGECFPQQH